MPKKVAPVLLEILDAIGGIERSIKGKDYAQFQSDWLLNHGVQRGIEIISEASRRIPEELLAEHADVPWHKIKAIGNILRHEYHEIQDDVIWDVAATRLAPLKVAVTAMRDKVGDD